MAPPKTPRAIIAKVNAALTASLMDPGVRKRIEDIGAIPSKAEEASPEWMDNFLRAEVDAWGKVVRAAGVRIE
jgi:tripartite-type tricarboxylate transporter receptor subunit TctC